MENRSSQIWIYILAPFTPSLLTINYTLKTLKILCVSKIQMLHNYLFVIMLGDPHTSKKNMRGVLQNTFLMVWNHIKDLLPTYTGYSISKDSHHTKNRCCQELKKSHFYRFPSSLTFANWSPVSIPLPHIHRCFSKRSNLALP